LNAAANVTASLRECRVSVAIELRHFPYQEWIVTDVNNCCPSSFHVLRLPSTVV